VIRLSAGDWNAEVLPELGGAIGRLDRAGRAVFRPAPEAPASPLETGCFPLVPYANRIDRGRFRWRSRDVALEPTPGFEPHALHGSGWREPWTVLEADAVSARLELRSPAGDWPWAWRAEQTIMLDDEGFSVTLSLTNEDATPMPGGLGLHPYFATEAGDRVRLEAPSVWVGKTLIPDRLAPASELLDWREGVERSRVPFVDNAYDGWTGVAEVIGADRTVRLTSTVSRLHVYAPEGASFVCLEPMTHRPNALNAPDGERSGLETLAPGQTMSLSMRVTEQ
jgi:aldose 1-epimerase